MRDQAALRTLLPHRHPVLLVDRVTACEPGTSIETVKTISASEPCFAGVPDDAPPWSWAYPPTLLLESFVQSAAVLWAESGRPVGTLVLASATGVRHHRRVFAGDALRHTVRLTNQVGSNAFLTGHTTDTGTGDEVMTVATIVLAIRPADALGGPR